MVADLDAEVPGQPTAATHLHQVGARRLQEGPIRLPSDHGGVVAVGLGDDGVPGQVRGQEIGILGQKLREGQDLPSQCLNVGVPW